MRYGVVWHTATMCAYTMLVLGSLFFFGTTHVHAMIKVVVNSESFDYIQPGNSQSNVELRFGDSGEKFFWNVEDSRFDLTDDLKVFGNLDVVGTLSGSAIRSFGLSSCSNNSTDKLLWDAATGHFTCGTDQGGGGGGISYATASGIFLKRSGGLMTGALTIQNGNVHTPTISPLLSVRGTISGYTLRSSNITVSGAVLYSSGNTVMQNAKGLSGQLLISQGTSAPKWANPVGGMMWYFDGVQAVVTGRGPQITMPFGLTLASVSLTAKGAPTGADLIYDINLNGTTIFSTRPKILAGQTTGGGSAVFATTNIPENATVTIDVDQVGSTYAGSGVTIMLKGTRKY